MLSAKQVQIFNEKESKAADYMHHSGINEPHCTGKYVRDAVTSKQCDDALQDWLSNETM